MNWYREDHQHALKPLSYQLPQTFKLFETISSTGLLGSRLVVKLNRVQGLPFKHRTRSSCFTTRYHCSQGSPRLLLPDHFLSISGYVSSWPTFRLAFSPAFPHRDQAFRVLPVSLPQILVAAIRGYPGHITRVSEASARSYFFCIIGLHWWICRRARIECISSIAAGCCDHSGPCNSDVTFLHRRTRYHLDR